MPTPNLAIPYLSIAQQGKETVFNANMDIIDNVLFVRRGTLASRPASLPAGALYVATDVGNESLYYSSAPGTWVNVTPGNGVHANWKGGTAPTPSAGANAGTSPPVPTMDSGSNDQRGGVLWGTGTSATAGPQVVVTFAVAYATAPFVVVAARSGLTYNSGLFVTTGTTSFTISAAANPLPSQVSGAYTAQFLVIG